MALPEKLESAEKLNRSELPEKQRIYALAKQLGIASKDLLQVVLDLGISGKVASSTLTLAEQNQVLDALSGAVDGAEPTEEESAEKTEPEALVEVLSEITPPPSTEPPVAAPVFSAPVFAAPTFSNADGTAPMTPAPANDSDEDSEKDPESGSASDSSKRRRRGSRGRGRGRGAQNANNEREANASDAESAADEPEEIPEIDEPMAIKGSTRLEAQRRRRVKRKAMQDRPAILSEAEFLARRESVSRRMVVRDRKRRSEMGRSNGEIITQIGVLEDDLLVEHFVATSDQASQVGNIYLGRVQNVLPSMEAAFIDIGTGRNGVLYAQAKLEI